MTVSTVPTTGPRIRPRRDRWADWVVVGMVIVALLLGWAVRNAILYRTETFTLAAGISGVVPDGWVKRRADDPLFSASNPFAGAFNTTLEVRTRPLAEETDPTWVLDALALERAGEVDGYQTFSTDEVLIQGTLGVQRTFAYVEVKRSPYTDHLPVVVRGVDVVLRDGGRVIVATYLSQAETFDANYRYFRTFVEGLEY